MEPSRWSKERGETLERAVIRETLEETGLHVTIKNIVAINEKFFPHAHAIFFTFGVRVVGGELSINDSNEITDIRWIDIEEAEKIMDYFPNGVQCFVEHSVAAPYYFQNE
ncbi:Nudix hydrolase family protein [Geomicrobium sp. JCM 19038]|nr:Nudix hydrolase family protein [Geomicrobium sp. JCM 19038]